MKPMLLQQFSFPSTLQPYNQWLSPTETWMSGHMALCRTCGRGSPQQCWHPPWYPLWTKEKIHAAPRSTWGSHTWSSSAWPLRLPKLTTSCLKWGPENPAVFPRRPRAVQIWQKLVSYFCHCYCPLEAQKVWDPPQWKLSTPSCLQTSKCL